MSKTYDIKIRSFAVPTDEESITRGKRLAITRGCLGCHREDLGGGSFFDDPLIGSIYADNLTKGEGGIGSKYTDEEIANVIRNGVKPDGTSVIFMPSHEFWILNDQDLGQIIAYIRSVPPIDRPGVDSKISILGRVFVLFDLFVGFPAGAIDHTASRPEPIPIEATVEYGEYLAGGCTGCHGTNYSGGPIPGAPPEMTTPANLTQGGELGNWTPEDFITTLRTGVNPAGHKLREEMPWQEIAQMTDIELEAIFLFLKSLPPLEDGNR